MTRKRAIATKPGQATQYVDFTPAEEVARDTEEAEFAAVANKIPKYDKLTNTFGTIYLTELAAGNLTKSDRRNLLELQAIINNAKALKDDAVIVDLIQTAVVPSEVSSHKQTLVDIVEGDDLQLP